MQVSISKIDTSLCYKALLLLTCLLKKYKCQLILRGWGLNSLFSWKNLFKRGTQLTIDTSLSDQMVTGVKCQFWKLTLNTPRQIPML